MDDDGWTTGRIGNFGGLPVHVNRDGTLMVDLSQNEQILSAEYVREMNRLVGVEVGEAERQAEEGAKLKAEVDDLSRRIWAEHDRQAHHSRTFVINADSTPPHPFPRPEFKGPTVTAPAGRAFRCPVCNATSHNPHDLIEGYCGACNQFTCNHRRCCPTHGTHTTPHMGCVMR